MVRQAQHERIRGIHPLVPHPTTPANSDIRVTAQILSVDTGVMMIEYRVSPADVVLFPPEADHVRTDGLWQTTCFEAFLKCPETDAYLEVNFSPSSAWAAYAFDGYRAGMRDLPFEADPDIISSMPSANPFSLSAKFEWSHLGSRNILLGLSAVIEETDGTRSYWALAHPPEKPDFHHPAGFVLTVNG